MKRFIIIYLKWDIDGSPIQNLELSAKHYKITELHRRVFYMFRQEAVMELFNLMRFVDSA